MMDIDAVANKILWVFDNFARNFTPEGQAISVVAHGLLTIVEDATGKKAPAPSINIQHLFQDVKDDVAGVVHQPAPQPKIDALTDDQVRVANDTYNSVFTTGQNHGTALTAAVLAAINVGRV